MTEHILNGSQIGSPFKQMGCKRMSQRVRAYHFFYPCQFAQLFNNVKNHHTCKPSSSTIKEQYIFIAMLNGEIGACIFYIFCWKLGSK